MRSYELIEKVLNGADPRDVVREASGAKFKKHSNFKKFQDAMKASKIRLDFPKKAWSENFGYLVGREIPQTLKDEGWTAVQSRPTDSGLEWTFEKDGVKVLVSRAPDMDTGNKLRWAVSFV